MPDSSHFHGGNVPTPWRELASKALANGAETPFYLFASEPVQRRLHTLEALNFGLPTTSWFSFKTQPLRPLIRWWASMRRPVEVVSEFEFQAAVAEGLASNQILINGPAKHRWLPRHARPDLIVNLDSLGELHGLLEPAIRGRWKLGLRIRTSEDQDPENPDHPTQFGMIPEEGAQAIRILRQAGIEPSIIHTHLRTNVHDPVCWVRAIGDLVRFCESTQWNPDTIDLGGGLPTEGTRSRSGKPYNASYDPELKSYAHHVRQALKGFRNARSLWLEHGRFLCSDSGVLCIRILDVKERGSGRVLICDGGRTLHALVSIWEEHQLLPLEHRDGPNRMTAVHGPTCMAFDQLGRRELPESLKAGDVLLWFDAGAYHLPWENRFSHGLCSVWWADGSDLREVRPVEAFSAYWGRWTA